MKFSISNFNKKIEKKIILNSILSFIAPPMGWMLIITLSGLVDYDGLKEVLLNPIFYVYCGVFLALNTWRNKQILNRIKQATSSIEVNKIMRKAPVSFFIFTATYGILGPPCVTMGLGFSQHVFYTSWLLGPVVISTFSIPFFIYYMILIDKFVNHIPLDRTHYYSIRRRFNTSIIYLVIGVMSMLSIVFFNISTNILNGVTISQNELIFKLVFFTILGVLIVTIPLLLQTQLLKQNLDQLELYVHKLKDGQLGKEFTINQRDELGLLMASVIELSSHFNKIIKEIKREASVMANLGTALKAAADIISVGSESQIDTSKTTKDSVAQLQGEVTQNLSNSITMLNNATRVSQDVNTGINELTSLVKGVESVGNRIVLLDDITRQTNLLAINASIEAATAGEHGKGFAVVAKEVRTLAERSKNNAEEIKKELITVLKISNKTKNIFDIIGPITSETGSNSEDINQSSQIQKNEIDNISRLISNLDNTIKEFDHNSKKVDKNSQTISLSADKLKNMSDFFTVT